MITQAYVRTMADYNAWQNRSIYEAAATLDDDERRQDRGAFFESIHATLSHLLWGDQLWLSRFAGTAAPAANSITSSVSHFDNWTDLKTERIVADQRLIAWAPTVTPAWLASDLTWYSGSVGRDVTKSAALLVTHMFNHQTHHRGQVHAMLTAAGAKPGVTDLAFMPD